MNLQFWKKKKIDWKKTVLAAVVFTVIAQITHSLFALIGMDYYLKRVYFPVWSKLMMPEAGPPPLSFTAYSLLFGFISAMIFAYIYNWVKGSLEGKTPVEKGLCFGLVLFFVSSVPSYLTMILLINLPLGLIGLWAIEGLLVSLAGGIAIVKIIG